MIGNRCTSRTEKLKDGRGIERVWDKEKEVWKQWLKK